LTSLCQHQFQQAIGIPLDQFARQQNHRPAMSLVALPQNEREQSRHSFGRTGIEAICGIEHKSGFRRIGDDEAQIGGQSQLQNLIEIRGSQQCPTHALDPFWPLHYGAILEPANEHVVAIRLLIEQLRPGPCGCLHDNDFADFLPPIVGMLDKAIDEASQESTGAKLEDCLACSRHLLPFG
jgi:hypothetical protein